MDDQSMVRRVALAICKSRTCEGASCCQWPANGGRTKCNAKDGAYDDAARDAIEAMIDPTKAMVEAGTQAVDDGETYGCQWKAKNAWRCMLDAAGHEAGT